MQEKIDRIQEELERAYRIYNYTEYTGTETEVAYMEGYITGMRKVIELLIDNKEA
jgi:hypothetical protein